MIISSSCCLKARFMGAFLVPRPHAGSKPGFKTLTHLVIRTPHADSKLAGNMEEPRLYTKYILFVKVTNCLLEYSFTGSD